MKILQISKYYTKKRGGGSVSVLFETVKFLKKKNQDVLIFSMKDPLNEPASTSDYFINHFDINKAGSFFDKIRLALKSINNNEAAKNIERLIKDESPDITHIHNIYHYITPSIIPVLKKYKIPIVYTLHDFKLICPNYKLFTKNNICEKCKGGKYYNCLFKKCLKDSYSVSFVAMLEAYFHRIKKSYEKVDLFIAPSNFMKNKCIEFGIPEEKIKVVRNFFDLSQNIESDEVMEKDYFLYFGRISKEKGIADLILATKKIKDSGKLGNNKLFIVGHGPEKEVLEKLSEENGMKKEIEFLGFREGQELQDMIRQSKFVVIPSVWYENSPMALIESQSLGRPAIVSNIGGTKESIIDKKTGLVFEAGNFSDLSDKISQMLKMRPEERKNMGKEGQKNILNMHDPEKIYSELMDTYKNLLTSKK